MFCLFPWQAHLYRLIEKAGITYVSVGHRRTLFDYHKRNLQISTTDPGSNKNNWHIEFIKRDTSSIYRASNYL